MKRAITVSVLLVFGLVLSACGGPQQPSDDPSVPTDVVAGGGSNGGPVTEQGDVCALLDQVCTEADTMEAAPQGATLDSSANYTVQDYLNYMVADLDETWTEWFLANGFQEPYVYYEVVNPGETFTTTCNGGKTVDDTYNNAFYCPADTYTDDAGVQYQGSLVLPETTFQQMWNGDIFDQSSAYVGDFAAAIIVAHEFGHHVQDEMLLQAQAANPGSTLGGPVGQNGELIADCFAGVWMASAYYKNMLIDTDYEEALSALYSIGDNEGSHGTPEERVAAVTAGYNSTNPMDCVSTYWR